MNKDSANFSGVGILQKYRLSEGETEDQLLARIDSGEVEPYQTVTGHNTWLNTGWTELLKIITGASTNTFTYANTTIGVGDDATAAAATQTDLIGTNKTYKAMEAGYPTAPSSQTINFKARFLTTEANYLWGEVVVKQNVSDVCWNRLATGWGTKTSAEIWIMTLTLGKG